jgi:hypothetical protein
MVVLCGLDGVLVWSVVLRVNQGLLHVFCDSVVVERREGVLDPIVLMCRCRLGCGDAQGSKSRKSVSVAPLLH